MRRANMISALIMLGFIALMLLVGSLELHALCSGKEMC